jgi:hypothetical protein
MKNIRRDLVPSEDLFQVDVGYFRLVHVCVVIQDMPPFVICQLELRTYKS